MENKVMNVDELRKIVLNIKDELMDRYNTFDKTLMSISMDEMNELSDNDAAIHFNYALNNFNHFLELYNIDGINASWRYFEVTTKDSDKLVLKKARNKREFLFYENSTRYIFCTNDNLSSFLKLKRGICGGRFLENSLILESFIAEIDVLCQQFNITDTDNALCKLDKILFEKCFGK